MPEGHRGAGHSLLGERDRAGGERRAPGADRGARQLAARAGEASGQHFRRRHREGKHSHGNPAGVRARRSAEAGEAPLSGRSRRGGAAHRGGLGAGQGEGLRRALFLLAIAASAAPAASRDEDLQLLRSRIAALSQELEAKEESRREARDALRDSERAISDANRTLAALQAEARALRADAARIAERRRGTQRLLAERRAALERMLAARAAAGAPDTVRVALSGGDPAAVSRQLHYLGYLSRAAAALIGGYRSGLAELERLARDADARRARLRAVEQASRADRERILKERRARRGVLERIAGDIRAGRKQIRVLRADEARLGRLIEGIGRVIARVEATP